MKTLTYAIAPEQLIQAINPWRFYQQGAQIGFVNIQLGSTPAPEVEQQILDEVGSYGRQIGRIGDVLEVLLKHVPMETLSVQEADAIAILTGQLAAVRQIKRGRRTSRYPVAR